MSNQIDSREVVTDPVRIAYPALFEPKPVSKDRPDVLKYQSVLLLPPDTDFAPYKAAIEAAMMETFGQVIELSAKNRPIKACADKGSDRPQGFEDGWYYLNAKTAFQPTLVDGKRQPIIDPSKIKPGYWCRFQLKAYGWKHQTGGQGVSFSIEAVQLYRPDEVFGGGRPVEEVFGVVDTGDDPDPFGELLD